MFLDKCICLFDLEFTDVNIAEVRGNLPYIVEIASIRIDRDLKVLDTYSSLVKPPDLDCYTEFSEEICHISKQQLELAMPWNEVWRDFAKFTQFNRSRLCSWGVSTDIPILKATYRYYELGYPHNVVPLDAITLSSTIASLYGLSFKSFSLDSAVNFFNVDVKSRHRALPDCYCMLGILKGLKKVCESSLQGEKFELFEF